MKPKTFLRAVAYITVAWALFAAAFVTINPLTEPPETERQLANLLFTLQQDNGRTVTKSEATLLQERFEDLQNSKQRVIHFLYASSALLAIAGLCLWFVQPAEEPRRTEVEHS